MKSITDPHPLAQNPRFRRQTPLALLGSRAGLVFAIVAVLIAGAISSPMFLTSGNFLDVMTNMSIIGIVLVGMSFARPLVGVGYEISAIKAVVVAGSPSAEVPVRCPAPSPGLCS